MSRARSSGGSSRSSSRHGGEDGVQGGLAQRGRGRLSGKSMSCSMEMASWSGPSGDSHPMRSREGRKQFLQEVFLTKSPISLQKLDNLARAWSRIADGATESKPPPQRPRSVRGPASRSESPSALADSYLIASFAS